jgi:hypothetical protein
MLEAHRGGAGDVSGGSAAAGAARGGSGGQQPQGPRRLLIIDGGGRRMRAHQLGRGRPWLGPDCLAARERRAHLLCTAASSLLDQCV